MPTDFDELKRQLLQTDEEFRQLATQHHDLDEKLHTLAARHYLSEPEQLEEVTLKKRKLQLKDQMESMRPAAPATEPVPRLATDPGHVFREAGRYLITRASGLSFLRPSSSMKIDRAGYPFIAGALVPAAALALTRRRGLAAAFGLLGAFFAYFFRDPDRAFPLPPASSSRQPTARVDDGRTGRQAVGASRRLEAGDHLPVADGRAHQPLAGRRPRHAHRLPARKFLPAYKDAWNDNELNEFWIDQRRRPVVFRQVVGLLARRIVCRVVAGRCRRARRAHRPDEVRIAHGRLPARRADLLVPVGQHVVAGETVLATCWRRPAGEPRA